MARVILEQRALVAMLIAMGVGAAGVHTYPVERANVYLQILELRNPTAFLVLVYGYAALWFTTPFFAASILGSLTPIVAYRRPARAKQRLLPAYLVPERRPAPTLVLGESHFETTQPADGDPATGETDRAPQPSWLTIPRRSTPASWTRCGRERGGASKRWASESLQVPAPGLGQVPSFVALQLRMARRSISIQSGSVRGQGGHW